MPDFMFQELPPGEAKKLPRGVGLVISVGSIALAIGIIIELWLGDSLGRHKGWTAALSVAVVLTICISALGFYRDHVQTKKHEEYMGKLHAIDRKTIRKD
jgi:MFS family permease